MKKFLFVVMLAAVCVGLTACSAPGDLYSTTAQFYDGSIIQQIYVEIDSPQTEITHKKTEFIVFLSTFNLNLNDNVVFVQEDDYIGFYIKYENYADFAKFNNVDEKMPSTVTEKKKLFFTERRGFMVNPHKVLNDPTNPTRKIFDNFTEKFAPDATEVQSVYLYSCSYRRTWTNADGFYRTADGYEYYYRTSAAGEISDIETFDRFANTPVWYGIAVGASVVFTFVFYFVLKTFAKKREQTI